MIESRSRMRNNATNLALKQHSVTAVTNLYLPVSAHLMLVLLP